LTYSSILPILLNHAGRIQDRNPFLFFASSTIHLAAMADLNNLDDSTRIIDGIKNAIIPLSDTVLVMPGQFLMARGTGIYGWRFV
jgi:hypothetical protein